MGAFAKGFKEQKAKNFGLKLEKELELLQSGKSNIQIKRDEYHKTALKAAPYR